MLRLFVGCEEPRRWTNGRLVPWEQASVHVATHTLHYGLGAFEGIRCYKLHDGRSAIFRLDEHVRRLFDSAHICMLPMPYSQEQIVEACLETVRENGLDDYYLRPIAFMGSGEILLGARSNPTHVAVVAWRLGAYPGEEEPKAEHELKQRADSVENICQHQGMVRKEDAHQSKTEHRHVREYSPSSQWLGDVPRPQEQNAKDGRSEAGEDQDDV